MTRAEKALRIHQILDELYPTTPIPLDHTDPFTLLVAVLLSAQTTDARVNLVTPGLFAKGPTPSKMAALTEDEILAEIKTCGLAPRKSKALFFVARNDGTHQFSATRAEHEAAVDKYIRGGARGDGTAD